MVIRKCNKLIIWERGNKLDQNKEDDVLSHFINKEDDVLSLNCVTPI